MAKEKGNGLPSGWKKIYGHQLDDKEALKKYRDNYDRIFGGKTEDQETDKAPNK